MNVGDEMAWHFDVLCDDAFAKGWTGRFTKVQNMAPDNMYDIPLRVSNEIKRRMRFGDDEPAVAELMPGPISFG